MEPSEREKAMSLRKLWMRQMGLDEDEITESLRNDPPCSVAEERKQLHALQKLDRITPSSHGLRQVAIKF